METQKLDMENFPPKILFWGGFEDKYGYKESTLSGLDVLIHRGYFKIWFRFSIFSLVNVTASFQHLK